MKKELEKLRNKIDKIDIDIVNLLNKRAELVKKIGEIKKENKIDIIDSNREKEIFNRVFEVSQNIIPPEDLKNIYREILNSSRKLQKANNVSLLGGEGSLSHILFYKYFDKNTNCVFCKSISDVFSNILKEESQFGIISLENFYGENNIDKVLEYLCNHNIKIWAELKIKTDFVLVSFVNKKEDIKKIYSTPKIFFICKEFIQNSFPNIDILEVSNISESIDLIRKDKNGAIILSSFILNHYKFSFCLNIKHSKNIFNFFLISQNENKIRRNFVKASIVTILNDKKKIFDIFKIAEKHKIDFLNIKSKTIKNFNKEILFLFEIKNINETFLKDLKNKSNFFRILGIYPVESIE